MSTRYNRIVTSMLCLGALMLPFSNELLAQKEKKAPQHVSLDETRQKLKKQYSTALESIKKEIEAPVFDEARLGAFKTACSAEKGAEARLSGARKSCGKVNNCRALVNHAKGKWIGGAEKGIAKAQEKLKKATTDAEREKAKKELARCQKGLEQGKKALKERQANLDEALKEQPRIQKELEAAEQALGKAQVATLQALNNLNVDFILKNDRQDGKLAKFLVLQEATPDGLALFTQQGAEQKRLVEQLLADEPLMIQMAVADGAKNGKYGQAMRIYSEIQKASAKAQQGVLQRLALAISLEHATPLAQRNPTGASNAPSHIDPVKRYLQFEKAYLNGELDEEFEKHCVWSLRFVVDGREPDDILVWGRKMLRNYRPDHVTTTDYRWRYVAAVRTDIKYGSQDNKFDEPQLQFFQNILKNGGVCGRRAFFGRFMLRAFGVPTTARPQKGHGALAHWTPDGWVVCLGGGWGAGFTKTRYKQDLDFLANTQARDNHKRYMEVKRAQWIGDVLNESRVFGLHSGTPGLWYGISLYKQRAIINETKAEVLAAVGTDIGEANESKVQKKVNKISFTDTDRQVQIDGSGKITIPAAACSKPTNNTEKIKFMPSNLGGMQLHYGRLRPDEEFEYTFEAPRAGKYSLTARVVTPSWKQHLYVAANGAEKPVDIELPFTVGMWDNTKPVEITLKQGLNLLRFTRAHEKLKGVTIRDFTLIPIN